MVERTSAWARSRSGLSALFIASLLETTVVPIPFEAIMVPMMLNDRARLWRIATVALLGCLAGALIGYGVGALAFETLGRTILDWLGAMEAFRSFQARVDESAFWLILTIGITPVPFQVATVGSGVTGYPLLAFLAAAAIARGVRYYALALLTYWFGARMADALHRYLRAARVGGAILLLAVLAYLTWIAVR